MEVSIKYVSLRTYSKLIVADVQRWRSFLCKDINYICLLLKSMACLDWRWLFRFSDAQHVWTVSCKFSLLSKYIAQLHKIIMIHCLLSLFFLIRRVYHWLPLLTCVVSASTAIWGLKERKLCQVVLSCCLLSAKSATFSEDTLLVKTVKLLVGAGFCRLLRNMKSPWWLDCLRPAFVLRVENNPFGLLAWECFSESADHFHSI